MSDWDSDGAQEAIKKITAEQDKLHEGMCWQSVSRENNGLYAAGHEHRQNYDRHDRPQGSGTNRPNDNNRRMGQRDRGTGRSGANYLKMEIDCNKTGWIIGKGGSKIREIQQNHNVNIRVDRNLNESGLCNVIIRGNADAIEKAKKTIEELTADIVFVEAKDIVEPEFVLIDWKAVAEDSERQQKEQWAKCPKLLKDFYVEDSTIAKLLPQAVALFRETNNNITVSRAFQDKPLAHVPIPNPIMRFEQCFSAYPDMLREINKQHFEKPSPIQCQAWPILLKGEDMIGIAQTGTGKTLAFLLPAMIHTEYQPVPRGSARGGPNVLVLAPTRELALQIEKEVQKYQFRGMKAVCVYGGGDRRSQMNTIQKGIEMAIATPGRLNDLIQAKVLDVSSVTYLVLDEADRMLDMGFEPQIRKILLHIRPDRQTVMTSATWPSSVRRLAEKFMINPIQVCVGSLDLAAVHSVTQQVEIMNEEDKYYRIMDFVANMSPSDKVIVFCGKKARADDLSSEISLKGVACQCIHGDRDQMDREQALEDIKTGEVSILIATDVASRGIDIEDLTHVINYDFPRNIEEYVHRVGRTGRAGRTGISLSLFTRDNWGSASELISILEEAYQEVPAGLRDMSRRFNAMKERRNKEHNGGYGGRGGGGGGGGFASRSRY